ncbi:MoaD/ThiS family protein [Myxococcota bacterium]|nr:MoaD/ThiS family protein [Myxococcota bacterium]
MPEVRLLAGLRDRLAGGSHALEVDASSVRDLLTRLVGESPDFRAAEELVFESATRDRAARDLRILVNGRSVQFLAGLDTNLQSNDTVTLHLTGARGYPGG